MKRSERINFHDLQQNCKNSIVYRYNFILGVYPEAKDDNSKIKSLALIKAYQGKLLSSKELLTKLINNGFKKDDAKYIIFGKVTNPKKSNKNSHRNKKSKSHNSRKNFEIQSENSKLILNTTNMLKAKPMKYTPKMTQEVNWIKDQKVKMCTERQCICTFDKCKHQTEVLLKNVPDNAPVMRGCAICGWEE